MKRRLSAFPAQALQHLGLLIAFVLLVAAHEYATAHPALAAILVFVFSLSYLAASIVARRANLLYATMLLGAVSYFLTCNALGAPGTLFPLLSVPLVVCLLLVGWYLKGRLGEDLASYPPTVFRAMNITVAVFAGWALLQVGGLMGEGGLMRYVAALTFLGYAGLYLAHCNAGASFIFIYVLSVFLTLGGVFAVAAVLSLKFCWAAAIASAGITLLLGTKFHRDRGCRWSRHFYVSSAVMMIVSLALSVWWWPFLLVNLAIASLLLWVAYGWLAKAVGDICSATMAERVVAKFFFLGSLGLIAPVVPMVFVLPTHAQVAWAALICAVTLSWVAFQRRDSAGVWGNVYVLAAAMFASAGLVGIARQLPDIPAKVLSLAVPLALLVGLGLLRALFARTRFALAPKSLARAAIFPAFFAWYIPLLQGELILAMAGAVAALVTVAAMAQWLKDRSFRCAAGSAIAGALVAAAILLAGQSMTAWIACAAVAAAAGGVFAWAGAKGKEITRVAANLVWLVLSIAAIVIAVAVSSPAQALYGVTAIALASVIVAGCRRPGRPGDVLDFAVGGLGLLATIAAVVIGPLSGLGPVVVGVCLLILSAAHWLAWGSRRAVGGARIANGLLAGGALLVIFGAFSAVDVRLGGGAAVVLVLFVLAAAMRRRCPLAAHSSVVAGHLTSIVLAAAALIQAWSAGAVYLPLAAAPMVLIYALMPRLRGNVGFRLGSALWLSFAALLSVAVYANTSYRQHIPLLAGLSLIWLAVGYALGRSKAKAWSMPLYVSAAILAGLCGIIRLFAPAEDGSWHIFLVNGVVFASLFLIIRQDIFAYLLTLSLSLMAYDWVKESTSIFTQDVLFYLVIGAVVLAAVFALPYMKKLLGRMGSVPVFSIFTRRGVLLVSLVVAAFTFLLVSVYSLKITGHPKFCTSCHNMEDYYASWQHSSHKDVACIQCHYEPGLTNTMMGKVAGLVQVVKYISHSYDSKPQAMISNAACMREGCHSDMDHSKETVLFRSGIRFRHDKHLSEHPRGKELNCVSCHGQTVRGEHISVGKTTCVTCHFHGRGDAPVAVGQCLTCHFMPEKPVTFMGQTFNHKEFVEGNELVQCSHCHSQVTQGDGRVSSTRCRSCHLGETVEIEDQELFHLVHVSKGHFDCLQCHDEIRHGMRPMERQLLASGNCKTCHTGERHSLQERIYAGTAVAELEVTPDAMYKAGVACDGCHTDVQAAGSGAMPFTKKVSGAKQCADCHGSKAYAGMLASWREDTAERLGELQGQLKELDRKRRSFSQAPPKGLEEVTKLIASARTRIAYVRQDGSYGAHNIDYISMILDSAEEAIEECQSLLGGLQRHSRKESAQ